MEELKKQRVRDKKIIIIPERKKISKKLKAETDRTDLDVIKTTYIVEGLSPKQISDRFHLPLTMVKTIIKEEKFDKLRRIHIRHGLQLLQNEQVCQAKDILDLESKFKSIRLVQLKDKLNDYMAYFSRHGDFYRRDPTSGEILKDNNDIPMQIALPNAAREMKEMKEAVIMASGITRILDQIELVLKGEDTTEGALSVDDFFDV